MIATARPVVGALETWMGGPFGRFETPTMAGLAMVAGNRLDLLAITARTEGQGHFRAFLAECKAQYDEIGIWEIINPELPATLERHGFRAMTEFVGGEWCTGMLWARDTHQEKP